MKIFSLMFSSDEEKEGAGTEIYQLLNYEGPAKQMSLLECCVQGTMKELCNLIDRL